MYKSTGEKKQQNFTKHNKNIKITVYHIPKSDLNLLTVEIQSLFFLQMTYFKLYYII